MHFERPEMTGICGAVTAQRLRVQRLVLLSVVLLGCRAEVFAADPQPYEIGIVPTGQTELDQALRDSSTLSALREQAPVGPFGLLARAREDLERFQTALRSFGYYEASVLMLVDGLPLDDPDLPDVLAGHPPRPVKIAVSVRPGPLYHLRRIDILGHISASARSRLDLRVGAPALAPKVLAAREHLLEALQDEGHALAKVYEPDAVLDRPAHALDVNFRVDAGPKVTLGAISLNGLEQVEEPFVRRRLTLSTGQPFDPRVIESAREDLFSLSVFSSVRATPAEQLDAQGRLPVSFEFKERKPHSVSANAAYSTDLGGSLSGTWRHYNLLGQAERLSLTAGVSQLGGSSTTGIGYSLAANFLKPDFLLRDQALQADLGALKQSLISYDEKSIFGSLQLTRKFLDYWNYAFGLSGEQAQITQEGVTRDYTLLGLPLTLKYDSSDSLLEPTRGLRATIAATPMQPLAGNSTSPFVILQASGSAYLDVGEPGRSVLALRGLVGDVEGAGQFDLPPNKRFYAGGSATVRGYKFQSIGPQFRKDRPMGGTNIASATVEFRQRILDDYGAVAFVDAGQVNASGSPFSGTWRFGAGLGARYYTSFGPIRLDVAMPLNKLPGGSAFELYIGVGQAF